MVYDEKSRANKTLQFGRAGVVVIISVTVDVTVFRVDDHCVEVLSELEAVTVVVVSEDAEVLDIIVVAVAGNVEVSV